MLSLLVFIRMDWIVQFSLSPFVVNNISLAPKGLKGYISELCGQVFWPMLYV